MNENIYLILHEMLQEMIQSRLNEVEKLTKIMETLPISNHQQVSPEQQVIQVERFKYIHVSVTSEIEREQIHLMICQIVKLPRLSLVCNELNNLRKQGKILSNISAEAMLSELRRLGLPDEDVRGFSNQNFYSYYNK